MSDRVHPGTLSLLLLAVLVVASGCGGSSFVGHHYDNFTAYYNTFYNARQAFDAGVKALERSDEVIDRRYYIDVFTAPDRASNSDRFQNAIDKSADVLRDHPDSKWVDDALLLIGKSYFYQQNFVGAEQKFREVISLGSALEDEARLWLARTLIAAGALDEARDHLVASLAQEDLSTRWEPRIHLALGELYVKQENFEAAAEELEAGLEEVRDNELEARGWFLLGQVLETLGRYDDAVTAFERVVGAHPHYELSYAANFSAVRVMGLHLDADEALRELRRMQRDDKNYSNRLELAYLNGLIYQAQGRAAAARNQYHNVLYDADGQLGDLRGRIHYALGELSRTVSEDYVLAFAHYDTARTSLSSRTPSGRNQEQHTLEAIVDAEQKAEMFGTFATVRSEIARLDSLLELGSLDAEEFADRILEIRRQKARALTEQQRLAEQRQAERGFQEAASRAGGGGGQADMNDPTGEAGFLFHRDPVRVQESRMGFVTRWGDRPLVPNWRRSEAIAAASSSGEFIDDAVAQRILDQDAEAGQEPLPEVDYSDVPRDSLSRASMRAQRALARYELGNVLFLAMNRPDSAATWYRMVIDEDPGENVAQRAYYALAEVQRSLGDSAAARSIYEQVLRDYPESDFAGRVREQLGISEHVPSDSITVAAEEYNRAFDRWRRGAHGQALNEMVSVAAHHRQTEVAPKALLAAGRIFLEWAEQDSLNIFGPIPLTVEASIIENAGLQGTPSVATNLDRGSSADAGAAKPQAAAERSEGEQVRANSGADSTSARGAITDRDALADDEAPQPNAPGVKAPKAAEREAAVGRRPSPRSRASDAEPLSEDGDDVPTLERRDDAVPPQSGEVSDNIALAVSARVAAVEPAGTGADSAGAEPVIAAGLIADPDTPVNVPEDSLANGAGGMLASAEDDGVYLHTLYASIKNQYPATVYANQADEMLSALESYRTEREAAAAAESQAAADALGSPDSSRDGDSLAAVTADSLAFEVTDSLVAAADSLAAEADTLNPDTDAPVVSANSAGADAPVADADSVSADAPVAGTDSVSTDVQAADAESRISAADSIDAERGSHLAGAETSEADSARANASDDAVPPRQAAVKTSASGDGAGDIPNGELSLRGEGGIDEELGGYTLVLGMNVVREPMETLAERYAEQGFRTDVVAEKVGSTTVYRAALGHFATTDQARRALQEISTTLEGGVQVAPLRERSSPR